MIRNRGEVFALPIFCAFRLSLDYPYFIPCLSPVIAGPNLQNRKKEINQSRAERKSCPRGRPTETSDIILRKLFYERKTRL